MLIFSRDSTSNSLPPIILDAPIFSTSTFLLPPQQQTTQPASLPSPSASAPSSPGSSLTALIHLVVEGYVVLDAGFYRSKSKLNFLAEVWKEYAKADSRYATRDAFTICMEFVTAFFVGPLCLFAAHQYCTRGPWRHLAALVASACQLYGDALYFATCAFEKGSTPAPNLSTSGSISSGSTASGWWCRWR